MACEARNLYWEKSHSICSAFSVGYVGVKMFGVGVKHAATIVLV